MEKRKEAHTLLFFKRLHQGLSRLSLGEQRVFMVKYAHALKYHTNSSDVLYSVSTRTVETFIDSLDRLLYDVDFMCYLTCYRHVSRGCGCERGTKTCLKPHQRRGQADLHSRQCIQQ